MNHRHLLATSLVAALAIQGAHADNPAAHTAALVCEHVRHAMPTPAPLSIALVDPGNVLFVCPGDSRLGGLTFTLEDAADLAYWRDNSPDRWIESGEEEGDN